jgi:predicted amidohydrolase
MLAEKKDYPQTATLAAVNWRGEWGNKAANLAKMKTKVKEASRLGVDMICFPELALTGYECGRESSEKKIPCAMHSELAEAVPGPASEEMAAIAGELGMYVIFGLPERDAKVPAKHYISAAVVGPEGVLGTYRKVNLAGTPNSTEDFCFEPGSGLPVFETRFGLIGVQICADFWVYPEQTRILALKGARVIFNPVGSGSGSAKVQMMVNATAAMAQSTQSYIVSCNHMGKERTASYYGHSTIAGPGFPKFYKVLAEGETEDEIVWATVNFKALDHARKTFQVKERGKWKFIADQYQDISDSISHKK